MTEPASAICTKARIKEVLAQAAGVTTYDSQIEGIQAVVASLAEKVCGRLFICGTSDVIEYYTVDTERNFFYALRKPIVSITSIYEDDNCKYESSSLLVADTTSVYGDYKHNAASARIERIGANWSRGMNAIKLTYKGGYSTTSALVTADPALAEVAAHMCAWVFNRTKAGAGYLGLTSKGKGDGSISFDDSELTDYADAAFSSWKHDTDLGF